MNRYAVRIVERIFVFTHGEETGLRADQDSNLFSDDKAVCTGERNALKEVGETLEQCGSTISGEPLPHGPVALEQALPARGPSRR